LKVFEPFQKLQTLLIAEFSNEPKFTGSLKSLRNMKELKKITIMGTNVNHGLEYLPESVEEFTCIPLSSENRTNDIYEELQPFGGDIKKWRETKIDKKYHLALSPLIPHQLMGEIGQKKKFSEAVKKVIKKQKEDFQRQEREEKFLQNIQELKYDKIDFNQ